MKKTDFKKEFYEAPECKVHLILAEGLICASVILQGPDSTEEDWENEEEGDGGEIQW